MNDKQKKLLELKARLQKRKETTQTTNEKEKKEKLNNFFENTKPKIKENKRKKNAFQFDKEIMIEKEEENKQKRIKNELISIVNFKQ